MCLTTVSLQPYRPRGEHDSFAHRIAHVLAFGGAALLLFPLGKGGKQEWMTALGIVTLAVSIETAQSLIYPGVFEWWDVRDDLIGLLLAALIMRRTRVRRLLLADG